MEKSNHLPVCIFISFVVHAAITFFFIFYYSLPRPGCQHSVNIEIEKKILPDVYEIGNETKIKYQPEDKDFEWKMSPDAIVVAEPAQDTKNKDLKHSVLRYQDSIKEKIQKKNIIPAGHYEWRIRVLPVLLLMF